MSKSPEKKLRKKLERIDAALINATLSWDDAQITDQELVEAVEAYRNAYDALGLIADAPELDDDDEPDEDSSFDPEYAAANIGDRTGDVVLTVLKSEPGQLIVEGLTSIIKEIRARL